MSNWNPKQTYSSVLVKGIGHICGISANNLILCNILTKESGPEVVREDFSFYYTPGESLPLNIDYIFV